MPADASFDVVSSVDRQEADNAVNQARKEVDTRYDFRGTGASLAWSGDALVLEASSPERVKAVLDVLQGKLVRRGIDLRALDTDDEPKAFGKVYRLSATLKDGLSTEEAKEVAKVVREQGPKGVNPQVQGDSLRVSSKKKDDLQGVIRLLKAHDFDFPLQFDNYR